MHKNYEYIDIKNHLHLWNECMKIYVNSFPDWEREDEASILKRVKSGMYKMIAFAQEAEIKGFYILDLYEKFDYILLSFLVVKEKSRGQGIGGLLCRHGIEYFLSLKYMKWLLIEAEYRQSLLYERVGFKKLDLDYAIPAYDSQKSIKMNLLAIQKEERLTQKSLKFIIENIFICGYCLNKDDERIKTQLNKIPKIIKEISC